MTKNKTNRRFRDPRSRRLSRYANCIVVLATATALFDAAAAFGTGWHLFSFHYTLLGIVATEAAAALALLEAARRVEVSRGFTGGAVAVAPAPAPWTGTTTPRRETFVLPPIPYRFETVEEFPARPVQHLPVSAAPTAPVRQPVPAPAPAVVETPTPAPVPAAADDQARELAGQP